MLSKSLDRMKSQEAADLAGKTYAKKRRFPLWKRYRLVKREPIVISAVGTFADSGLLRDKRK
jgi:hypothetical protein